MVLDRDPFAVYRVLEVPDTLSYNDSVIILITSANGLEIFENITSLLVESPFELRQYFRIAPGLFSGYGRFMEQFDQYAMISVSSFYNAAQFVVSGSEAFMVQFGVNPNVSEIIIIAPNMGNTDNHQRELVLYIPTYG